MLQARDAREGFVLVSVLWMVLAVAGLATLFVRMLDVNARSSAAYIRSAVAEAAADGAIRLIAYRLAAGAAHGGERQGIPVDGSWWTCRLYGDVAARISVQDQDGLIDLNRAPTALLQPAIRGVIPAGKAEIVLGEIAARRDSGHRDDVGLMAGARTGFSASDELFGPRDLTPDEADRVAQLFTIYSRSDGIDPESAPPALLALLVGGASWEDAGLPGAFVRQSRMRVFSVTADVGSRARGRSVRRAVLELVRSPETPFRVLEWSTVSGLPDDDDSPGSGEAHLMTPCLPPPDPQA